MTKSNIFKLIIILFIVFSCSKKNNVKFIGSYVDYGKDNTNCPGGVYVGIILQNKSNYDVYFSSFNSKTLKAERVYVIDNSGRRKSSIDDYFKGNTYDLVLKRISIDTLFICDNIDTNVIKSEYILKYRINNKFEEISCIRQ